MLPESHPGPVVQANGAVDLSMCASEPIHIPGLIQPHGLLLVLEAPELVIRQASENSATLVGIPARDLVDHPLDLLLGTDQGARLRMILRGDDLIRANPLKLRLPDRPGGREFNVLVHQVDRELVLEAEPIPDDDAGNFQAYYHDVLLGTARLQATEGEETLCRVAADEVRRIIGYDRVMVYRFGPNWNGLVVAESQDNGLRSSYLGLHFPASDIPEQARRLYTVHRVRCIPDVDYSPVDLISGSGVVPERPLDMSHCVLRSVSPIHLEYLRNMGIAATLTVSLMKDGVLWGLIACHHHRPRLVCPERRLTCSFLGQIIEAQLAMREEGAERAYRVQTSAIQMRFLDLLARSGSLNGLADDPTSVLDFVDARGAAIVQGMKCTLLGQTPPEAEIPGLIDSMTGSLDRGVSARDSLTASYSPAVNFRDLACGMLGVEVSRKRGDYLLWFLPELARTVNWAGNPDKAVDLEEGTSRLRPRKSFELWKEAVTLHSRHWKPCEVAAAIELGETFRNVMAGAEELRARDRRRDAITELGRRALAATDTKSLSLDAVALVSRTLQVEICRLFHISPGQVGLEVHADASPPDAETMQDSMKFEDPLAVFCLASAGPVVVDDLRVEVRFDGRPLHHLSGAVSGIAVPIADRDVTYGVITVCALQPLRFDRDDVHFLQHIANILIAAIRRKRVEEKLEHQSRHDDLTGLPNRVLLMERLERAVQNIQSPPAILLLDLDRFKVVNDTLGHHFGDLLLRQVADRFRRHLRAIDTLARLGGDEFVVLLPQTCEGDAVAVAQRILAELNSPFLLEGRACDVGASIGIAIAIAIAPNHGDDPNSLMRRADVAMYAAKRSGGGFAVYSADQDDHDPTQLDLTSDLRQAIEGDGLVLHYQPKWNLRGDRLEAVEALARWPHPRLGLIPPSRFIPIAEQAGLMGRLECWALDRAIDQHRRWRDQGLHLGIAVNVSPRFLDNNKLYEAIACRFKREDLPIPWLTLELTENTLMRDPKGAIEVLTRLRGDLGLKISVDDFGVGYSSLAYLRRLPLDEIKIDREFVKDMATSAEDAAIVKLVIELGHHLGLQVVAEGVEDRETLDLLASLGCDQAQGYFISRPIPAGALATWATSTQSTQSTSPQSSMAPRVSAARTSIESC